MKRLVLCSLIALMFVAAASAELLVTANPMGQGKWGFLGAVLQDSNFNNSTANSLQTVAGYVAYGVTDKCDVYLQLANGSETGLGAGITNTVGAQGLAVKYAVMSEGKDMPVTVSVGAGYKTMSVVTVAPAPFGGTTNGNQLGVAVEASKIMAPFVPYAGLTYRSTSLGGAAASTQIDLTVGTAIAWSMQGAVLVEATAQSITPNGGSAYSSTQVAAGVAYKI
jgi:hypothetical protein